jgi:hypothetical protein
MRNVLALYDRFSDFLDLLYVETKHSSANNLLGFVCHMGDEQGEDRDI